MLTERLMREAKKNQKLSRCQDSWLLPVGRGPAVRAPRGIRAGLGLTARPVPPPQIGRRAGQGKPRPKHWAYP